MEIYDENIKYLSLNNCNLKHLDHLPDFPNLYKLDLNDNFIDDYSPLSRYFFLSQLSIHGTKSFKGLDKLENLVELEIGFYEKSLFELCPNLLILDGRDEQGN